MGSRYEYSNYGAGLLGHLLALRAGSDYPELLRQRIARPLGMTRTGIDLTPKMLTNFATGHRNGLPVKNWDIPTLAGAGAIRSTARDMLRFLAANLGVQDPGSLNIQSYPQSANVYDSLAEAYMEQGEVTQAILNYLEALKRDPANENARRRLREMGLDPGGGGY